MSATPDQQIQILEQHLAKKPGSPLSVRLAALYLEQGRSDEALKLCDAGIASFPLYTTAHLVKGKALQALRMQSEARREFELVLEILPGNAYAAELLGGLSSVSEEALLRTTPEAEPAPEAEPSAASPEPPAISADADAWLASQFMEESQPLGTPVTLAPAEESAAPPVETPSEEEADPLAALRTIRVEEVPLEETLETGELTASFTETAPPESPLEALEQPQVPAPDLAELQPPSPLDVPTAPTEEADTFGPVVETGGPPDQFASPPESKPQETVPAELQDLFPMPEMPLGGEVSTPTAEPSGVAAEPEGEFDPFGMAGRFAAPPAEQPVETLEAFSDRMRSELANAENTLSLEEYLQQPLATPSIANEIEDLAQRLAGAGRLTPVINLSERTARVEEDEPPTAAGFVTPTLAEIYAKQGWYDDAIKAYRALAINKPAEKDRFEQRIRELEELKKGQEGS